MKKAFLFIILTIFFIENIELDSVFMCGVEFLHSRASSLRREVINTGDLYDFIYSPENMRIINSHDLLVDGEYYDIVDEGVINNELHYYCKADKAEAVLMTFISWIKNNKENSSPVSSTGVLKSKFKSLKYFSEYEVEIKGVNKDLIAYSIFTSDLYHSPWIKIPVPPPLT